MQSSAIEHRRLLLKFLLGSPLLSLGCTPTEQKAIDTAPSLNDLIKKASDAINIFDFEKIANQKLPPAHLGYLTTGVRDNITRDANQEAYREIKLSLHRLVDTRSVDMTTTLLGKKWPTPLFLSTCLPRRWRTRNSKSSQSKKSSPDSVHGFYRVGRGRIPGTG